MFIPASVLLAQDKHNLSVEFNVNRANYKMESLNSYLGDTNYFLSIFYDKKQVRAINSGKDYNLIISYQPFNFLDVGVYVNYQSSSIQLPLRLVYVSHQYPFDSITYEGTNYIEANALSTGLSTRLYINKLMHLDQSNSWFLKKLQLSMGFSGGLGFSSLIDRASMYNSSNTTNNSNEHKKHVYKAIDFQGRVELNLGYRLGKNFFSEVGIKTGYQFLKTSPPKNYSGLFFYPEGNNSVKTINLDFSGAYYGIYLKLGK